MISTRPFCGFENWISYRPTWRAQERHSRGVDGVNESSYPRRRFVQGIEDRPYFHWQLGVFLESTVGQLPPGWDVVVVVCNNHQPISEELQTVFATYGVTHFTGASPADNHDIDFAGGGRSVRADE